MLVGGLEREQVLKPSSNLDFHDAWWRRGVKAKDVPSQNPGHLSWTSQEVSHGIALQVPFQQTLNIAQTY